MAEEKTVELFCVQCGKALKGKQKKYCGDSCRVKHFREKKREHKKRNGATESVTHPEVDSEIQLQVVTLGQERDRAIASYQAIVPERDRLLVERTELAEKIGDLQRENGVLQGRVIAVWILLPVALILLISVLYLLLR